MPFLTRQEQDAGRPLPNTYWVIPDRLLAGEYPGDADAELARERIAKLHDAGVDAFFDLTEEDELPPYRQLLRPGAEYHRSAIPDTWVPRSAEQTRTILSAMRKALARGRVVYVHCRAGIGRTGLVVGCFLADETTDGKAALRNLNRLWRQSERTSDWPRVPQTREQADYIRRWPELSKTVDARAKAVDARAALQSSPDATRATSAAAGHPATATARAASAPRNSGPAIPRALRDAVRDDKHPRADVPRGAAMAARPATTGKREAGRPGQMARSSPPRHAPAPSVHARATRTQAASAKPASAKASSARGDSGKGAAHRPAGTAAAPKSEDAEVYNWSNPRFPNLIRRR